jgi:dihydrofolate reductase
MAKFIYEMNVSLDGYTNHEHLGVPDPALFRYFIELTRKTAGAIYGRGLYEAMRYWDGDDWDQHDAETREDLRAFAHAWRAMPKWVVSRSLKSVGPNATLIGDGVQAAIRAVKEGHDGEIEVGGPALAGALTEWGLIDEYRLMTHPVALGHGRPYFKGPVPALRLIAHERIGEKAIKLTYAPVR